MAKVNLKTVIKWSSILFAGVAAIATKINEDTKDKQLAELWEAHEAQKANQNK